MPTTKMKNRLPNPIPPYIRYGLNINQSNAGVLSVVQSTSFSFCWVEAIYPSCDESVLIERGASYTKNVVCDPNPTPLNVTGYSWLREKKEEI